jgi:hypothetical protein
MYTSLFGHKETCVHMPKETCRSGLSFLMEQFLKGGYNSAGGRGGLRALRDAVLGCYANDSKDTHSRLWVWPSCFQWWSICFVQKNCSYNNSIRFWFWALRVYWKSSVTQSEGDRGRLPSATTRCSTWRHSGTEQCVAATNLLQLTPPQSSTI